MLVTIYFKLRKAEVFQEHRLLPVPVGFRFCSIFLFIYIKKERKYNLTLIGKTNE